MGFARYRHSESGDGERSQVCGRFCFDAGWGFVGDVSIDSAVGLRTGREGRWEIRLGLVVCSPVEDPSLARRAKVINSL